MLAEAAAAGRSVRFAPESIITDEPKATPLDEAAAALLRTAAHSGVLNGAPAQRTDTAYGHDLVQSR